MLDQDHKLSCKQFGARKPPWLCKNNRGNQSSLLAPQRPGLGCSLGLAVLQVELDLGWIFLHGCKL